MPLHARSMSVALCLAACACTLAAQTALTAEPAVVTSPAAAAAPASWLDSLWNLPIFHWFGPQPLLPPGPPAAPPQSCPVSPLPPITDPVAEAFNTGESLDTADLAGGMARALARFAKVVTATGGSIELKSAYRPPAYQLHLQQVWDKWMQLRNNREAGCQDLRAEVRQEFARHHLLESQRPVSSSDHTRGLAFDAAVVLPPNARIQRRKATVDRLAHLAGLARPDILHDPVHFKYVGYVVTERPPVVRARRARLARRSTRRLMARG